ncbi:MAG: AAA family ATPase [Candidatus Nanoarchaeia archaeon]
MEIKFNNKTYNLEEIQFEIIERDIENIWKSYKSKTLKEFIEIYSQFKVKVEEEYSDFLNYKLGDFLMYLKNNGDSYYKSFLVEEEDLKFCKININDLNDVNYKFNTFFIIQENNIKLISRSLDFKFVSPSSAIKKGNDTNIRNNNFLNEKLNYIKIYGTYIKNNIDRESLISNYINEDGTKPILNINKISTDRKSRRKNREENQVRISKISIKHFKGIQDELIIETDNKSLLIFGENGTGKSSIYEAINIGLDQNDIYNKSNKGYFKIYENIFAGKDSEVYLEHNAQKDPIFLSNALDYKKLALIHTISIENQDDFYNFLLSYLHHFKMPSLNNKFLVKKINEIKELDKLKNKLSNDTKKYLSIENQIKYILDNLNKDVNQLIILNLSKINEIFKRLTSKNLEINELSFNMISKKVNLSIKYFNKLVEKNKIPYVLNEAKISALALSIYLTLIKENKFSVNKFLILDDLLISLDYEHRMPLVDILLDEFNDSQIFLLTHDKKWFEIIEKRIQNKNKFEEWKTMELLKVNEIIEIRDSKNFTDKAKHYLEIDKRISGVYCRLEFERLLGSLFEKNQIPISCYRDSKFKLPTSGDFINSLNTDKFKLLEFIEKINFEHCENLQSQIRCEKYSTSLSQFKKIRSHLESLKDVKIIIEELVYFKDIILNNSSHNNEEWYFKGDIEKVIQKLEKLASNIENN